MKLTIEDFIVNELTTEEQKTISGGDQGTRWILGNNTDCGPDDFCTAWFYRVD
ncbi:hypothetical protein D3C87_1803670 [compost metagenome]|jgi:hypothetical protein